MGGEGWRVAFNAKFADVRVRWVVYINKTDHGAMIPGGLSGYDGLTVDKNHE